MLKKKVYGLNYLVKKRKNEKTNYNFIFINNFVC